MGCFMFINMERVRNVVFYTGLLALGNNVNDRKKVLIFFDNGFAGAGIFQYFCAVTTLKGTF